MIHKDAPVRSKKLRDSARGQPCCLRIPGHCTGDPATTVLCHLPHGGRGTGHKASDDHAVYGCTDCHAALDGRALVRASQAEMYECMVRALAETRAIQRSEGLVSYE
jgi:hypothetical protein